MSLRGNTESFGIAMIFIVLLPIFGSYFLWELFARGILIDEVIKGSISITDVMIAWSLLSIVLGIFIMFLKK